MYMIGSVNFGLEFSYILILIVPSNHSFSDNFFFLNPKSSGSCQFCEMMFFLNIRTVGWRLN